MPNGPYRKITVPQPPAMQQPQPPFRPPMQSHIPPCNDNELSQRLLKAMTGEQDARAFYLELANMTNDPEDKQLILGFARDEMKHFNNFARLYRSLTGRNPSLPPVAKPSIRSFLDGVRKSIMDETDAYEFYRDTYLCTNRNLAKSIFFEAFTDENEHAIRLNYIFTKNKR